MLRPQHFYNNFIINLRWLAVTDSNLNSILTSLFYSCWGPLFFVANMIFGKPRPRLDFGLEIWPKGYIKIYSFHLSVTLSHQPRLISYYLIVLIGLISENPFRADDMSIFGPWDKFPYVIPHKLIQFFMHWLHPILILKSFFYHFWLKLSKVARISHMVCNKYAPFSKM